MNDKSPKLIDSDDKKLQQKETKRLLSAILVGALIGIAFQEMVNPVRESIRAFGFTWQIILLFFCFFFTAIRFYLGNQLHLLSDSLLSMKGTVWLFDLIVILFETALIVFLGGVSSVEESSKAKIGFFGLLLLLLAIDIVWILSQWLFGGMSKEWKRKNIPWQWALLNFILAASMVLLIYKVDNVYSPVGLIWLTVLSVTAFICDVRLINYCRLI